MKEKIIVNQNIKNKIIDNLSDIVDEDVINKYFEDEYYSCDKNNIISKISSIFDDKFFYVISNLCLGYNYEDMTKEFPNLISDELLDEFDRELDKVDLSVDNIISLYKYDNKLDNGLSKSTKETVLNHLYEEFKKQMSIKKMSNKYINQIFDYLLSMNYTKPMYKNYLLLRNYLSREKHLDNYYYIIRNYIKKIDFINNYDEIKKNMTKPLKMVFSKSIISYAVVNKRLISGDNLKKISISSCCEFNTVSKRNILGKDEVEIKIYIPKGTEGVPFYPLNEYENIKVLLRNFDLFFLGYDKKDEYINALLISKNIKNYANSKDEVIEKYNELLDYKNEVNRELSFYNVKSLQSIINISKDSIKHSLELSNNKTNEVLLNKEFEYNEFDLNVLIIGFIRRIPVINCEIISNTINSLVINGINNNNLIINNIDLNHAKEIKKIVLNISPDLYFMKNKQVYRLKSKKNPLMFLSAKNIAGNVNILIISLIAIAIAIITIIIIYSNIL